ncbi:ABC-2 type transport system ATP-binding protein [Streptococcus rupicaprae]|uniref:ABC-2 type transport system ATP-binding protein n=1 Tax=Streptococcus rupicaprae TaxID=759619 RepID=A0ABV2FKL2_9STRE
MESIIKVENLSRTYGTESGFFKKESRIVKAVKEVSFDVKRGEIFGLLGQNGAGKSTIIKILSTMLLPTSGQVSILGYDVFKDEAKIRERINFVFGGERSLYYRLTAEDNLFYFADLYKISRKEQRPLVSELLDLVGLGKVANRRVETFSKGMKQRLQIARALLNDPEIIFLDEPSIGLDPVGAMELRQLIKEMAARGKTVLLTTHYMAEAEELCDRIAIINKGQLITCGTLGELASLITDVEREAILAKKLNQQEQLEVTLEDIYIALVERG